MFSLIGTPGSYGILQTTTQILHHLIDARMNIQEAIEAPRFRCRNRDHSREALSARARRRARQPRTQSNASAPRLVANFGEHMAFIWNGQGSYFGGADQKRTEHRQESAGFAKQESKIVLPTLPAPSLGLRYLETSSSHDYWRKKWESVNL
ncbi:MAG: gamma-glutamyltransferase [Burkholderiales bacterium]|nr:gamma-glutamyltransferase [Burkholderiales bacterium]